MNWLFFTLALTSMLAGSYFLSGALDRVGTRLGLSAGLLGLLAALGSDSPEIASALTALVKGEHEVGIGVVLGSNMFNLAALMGLGALIARGLPVSRGPLLLNAVTSLLITAGAGLLLSRLLPPVLSVVMLGVIFAIYFAVLWFEPRAEAGEGTGAFGTLQRWHAAVHAERKPAVESRGAGKETSILSLALLTLGSLAAIVVGAVFTVQTGLQLGSRLHVPRGIIGSVVLAALSSVPNVFTSARLARQRRGTAVVSETVNSNTVNILVGIGVPAVVFGVSAPSVASLLELGWLVLMTAAALLLSLRHGRLGRAGGVVLIALYAAFVTGRILWR